MRTTKPRIIKCPRCGREYLPAEIFYPKYFFGEVSDIIKDQNGEIISYRGESINPIETYICDGCQTALKVTARVNFDVEIDEKNDFYYDATTKPEEKFSLFEG